MSLTTARAVTGSDPGDANGLDPDSSFVVMLIPAPSIKEPSTYTDDLTTPGGALRLTRDPHD
jgi:hypothetical protein